MRCGGKVASFVCVLAARVFSLWPLRLKSGATDNVDKPDPELHETRAEYIYGPDYVDEFILQTYKTTNPQTGQPEFRDRYMLQDANYNVVGITDTLGGGGFAMVAQYAWEPYGTLAATDRNGPEFGNRVGHQGLFYYSFDSTNPGITAATAAGHGLYYNRNRWYSPKLGRFTTLDPNESAQLVVTALAMNGQALELLIEGFDPQGRFVGGMNLFVYAGSNPLRHGDPLGLIYDPFEEVDKWADDRAGNALYTLGTLNQGATLGLQASLEIASILLGLDVFQSVNVLMDGTGGFWDAMNIVMSVNPVGRLGKAGARIGKAFKYMRHGRHTARAVGSIDDLYGMIGLWCRGINPAAEAAAKAKYPKLAQKPNHEHHIIPKYLGGKANGPTVPINPAYHQEITNEFRKQWPYGQRKPTPDQLERILDQVYSKFSLPK